MVLEWPMLKSFLGQKRSPDLHWCGEEEEPHEGLSEKHERSTLPLIPHKKILAFETKGVDFLLRYLGWRVQMYSVL